MIEGMNRCKQVVTKERQVHKIRNKNSTKEGKKS